MESIPVMPAFLINWGWLRIGPSMHIDIDPEILHIGPLTLHWYGLMYVVAIVMGLWCIRGYTAHKGITKEQIYRMLWWCVVAGLFWRAIRERLNPLVVLDAGALFAACAQPFGRIGNLINGDIIGYPSQLPWSTVYDNAASWACQNPSAGTCHVPVQPAAGYELLLNLALIALLILVARRTRQPGMLLVTYLFGYAVTQFLVFFARANLVISLGPLDLGLKQAQWTSLIVFLILIPLTLWVRHWRYARVIPSASVPATAGIPQKSELEATHAERKTALEERGRKENAGVTHPS